MSKSREVLVGYQSRSKSRQRMDTSGQEESGRRKPDIDLFTLKVNKLFKGNEYQGHSRVQSLPTETKATYKIPKLPPRTNVSFESLSAKTTPAKHHSGLLL